MFEYARTILANLLLFTLVGCASQQASTIKTLPIISANPGSSEIVPLSSKPALSHGSSTETVVGFFPPVGTITPPAEGEATDERVKFLASCPFPTPGFSVSLRRMTPDEIGELARHHLAECLGVPLEEIQIVSVETIEWERPVLPSIEPPLKAPDRAYAGPLYGYRIVLFVKGMHFECCAIRNRLFYCGLLAQ